MPIPIDFLLTPDTTKEYVGLVWKRTCFIKTKQVFFYLIVVAVLLNVLKLAHHEKSGE